VNGPGVTLFPHEHEALVAKPTGETGKKQRYVEGKRCQKEKKSQRLGKARRGECS